MPFRFAASLLSPFMANDAYDDTDAPAPLPRHEREWRHPSEIAAEKRIRMRMAAPRLSSLVAIAAATTAVALLVTLCLLIAPRNAPRESLPSLRNSTITNRAPSSVTARQAVARQLAAGITDDGRVLVPVDRLGLATASTNPTGGLVLTVGSDIGTGAVLVDGRRIALRALRSDPATGLALFVASAPSASNVPPVGLSSSATEVGSDVVVVDSKLQEPSPVHLQIGVAVTIDEHLFVPLSNLTGAVADIDSGAISDGSPVLDEHNELVGLFAHRGSSIGYVPAAAISRFLDAAVASRHG